MDEGGQEKTEEKLELDEKEKKESVPEELPLNSAEPDEEPNNHEEDSGAP